MFTRLQARHFRSLKSLDLKVGPFQALVGPNASGKTTVLDLLVLLSDIMRLRGDVTEAVQKRSADFEKLLWLGRGTSFQIALETDIPDEVRARIHPERPKYSSVRYEVEIGLEPNSNEIGLDHERLFLVNAKPAVLRPQQRTLFPECRPETSSLFLGTSKNRKAAVSKIKHGNDNFYPEGSKSYAPSFRLGRTRSALANTPADEGSFPVTLWFRALLELGVQNFVLDSQVIRQPSPPGQGRRFQTDGSNLPWVIHDLARDQRRFTSWIDHVRTALPDVRDIRTIEREEDRHRYLVVEYDNGAIVPSWLVSDGTLRLLALTIPAYLRDMRGVFLIEEPENGIHPRAIETVVQSLTSIYGGQVLVATHSPVVINRLETSQVLCFAKDSDGATDVVAGNEHPALRQWKQGNPDLGILFASGILS